MKQVDILNLFSNSIVAVTSELQAITQRQTHLSMQRNPSICWVRTHMLWSLIQHGIT